MNPVYELKKRKATKLNRKMVVSAELQFWFHYNEFGPILMVVSGAKPIIRPAFLPRPSATFYNVTVPSAL